MKDKKSVNSVINGDKEDKTILEAANRVNENVKRGIEADKRHYSFAG